MSIKILPAFISDKPVLQRLMELYQYDFSEFTNTDLNEHGCFGYSHLDYYWVESNRHPFLIKVDGQLAGFVLVHQYTYFKNSKYHMAEFFVLRKYRKQGIGRQVAVYIFDLLKGSWEIYQAHTNFIAQKFWQNVIGSYTSNRYTETIMEEDGWAGIIRCFDNTNNFQSE